MKIFYNSDSRLRGNDIAQSWISNLTLQKKQFINKNILNLFSHFFMDFRSTRRNDNPLKMQLHLCKNDSIEA